MGGAAWRLVASRRARKERDTRRMETGRTFMADKVYAAVYIDGIILGPEGMIIKSKMLEAISWNIRIPE